MIPLGTLTKLRCADEVSNTMSQPAFKPSTSGNKASHPSSKKVQWDPFLPGSSSIQPLSASGASATPWSPGTRKKAQSGYELLTGGADGADITDLPFGDPIGTQSGAGHSALLDGKCHAGAHKHGDHDRDHHYHDHEDGRHNHSHNRNRQHDTHSHDHDHDHDHGGQSSADSHAHLPLSSRIASHVPKECKTAYSATAGCIGSAVTCTGQGLNSARRSIATYLPAGPEDPCGPDTPMVCCLYDAALSMCPIESRKDHGYTHGDEPWMSQYESHRQMNSEGECIPRCTSSYHGSATRGHCHG